MNRYKFKRKSKAVNYSLCTLVAGLLSVFILIGLEIKMSKEILYLIISILSLRSILVAVKVANKTFNEIVIHDDFVTFHFVNKMKEPLSKLFTEITTQIVNEGIQFTEKESGKLIGYVKQGDMEKPNLWSEILAAFKL